MSIDLLKILSDSNKDIDNQKLMDYLTGQLSAREIHEVEKSMATSDFVNDAVEGLMEVTNSRDISTLVEQLNKDLGKKLQQRKSLKEKRKLKEYPWMYFSLVLILLLMVAAWFVIHRLRVLHP
ncbi:MAG: hypothetical protein ABIN89_28850 [Chitinophagaceae bacterium]